MNYEEEIPRNTRMKRSKAKPPKKSKHKHVYEPCVMEYNCSQYTKEHGITYDKRKVAIGAYCPICGKVGELDNYERWFQKTRYFHPIFQDMFNTEPTEECARELNPETRTLPTFWCEDGIFQKFVDIEGRD